jgi:PhzF family phenazine biosynthesis protein
LEAGGEPADDHIVQECGAGLVRIQRTPDGALSFAAPPRNRTGPLEDDILDETVRGLDLSPDAVVDHQWCDNGPGWRGLLLRSTEDLHSVSPDPELLAHADVGLIAPSSVDTDFEVRAFFPGNQGITEDPVTGSLNAALGQWLIGAGLAPDSYTALQGRALGRRGLIYVERHLDDVWVGGRTVTVIDGTVSL